MTCSSARKLDWTDGREAVQFLVRVKECLENPQRLLLGL